MKWKKFLELQAQHPYLSNDLSWRGVLHKSREFIRTKVGFIAFRPFEKLDLSATESSSSTPLKSNYQYVTMECYKTTDYQLVFHVEGEDEGSCIRFITSDVGNGSIQAHIDEVTEWFEGCEAFRNKQLIWERVIKRTIRASSYVGLTEMNLEVYVFPQHYRFKPIPREPLPPTDPATIAYLTGGEMPPIIPSMI